MKSKRVPGGLENRRTSGRESVCEREREIYGVRGGLCDTFEGITSYEPGPGVSVPVKGHCLPTAREKEVEFASELGADRVRSVDCNCPD